MYPAWPVNMLCVWPHEFPIRIASRASRPNFSIFLQGSGRPFSKEFLLMNLILSLNPSSENSRWKPHAAVDGLDGYHLHLSDVKSSRCKIPPNISNMQVITQKSLVFSQTLYPVTCSEMLGTLLFCPHPVLLLCPLSARLHHGLGEFHSDHGVHSCEAH